MNQKPTGYSEEFSDDQLDTLLGAAARQPRPDTSAIEYCFETRVIEAILEKQEALKRWTFSLISFRLAPFLGLAAMALFIIAPTDSQNTSADNSGSAITGSSIFDVDESPDGGLWEDWN